MPFIKPERRPVIDLWVNRGKKPRFSLDVGDMCYAYYKVMVDAWRADPRWTTAHMIYDELFNSRKSYVTSKQITASGLAWQVFFHLHVMPYEIKKRDENGDI